MKKNEEPEFDTQLDCVWYLYYLIVQQISLICVHEESRQ